MGAGKDRGTRWETAVVNYLHAHGFPHVERRALTGNRDRGDIAGIVGVCIECKSTNRFDLAGWIAEATTEGRNADADVAVVWAKRPGRASPADGYVVMTGAQFVDLLVDLYARGRWTA